MIPYGPTGNGFFAMLGAKPERFRSPENLARADRAAGLAAELGATPNQVALAWLLHQPFPVIPILGTSRVDHLEDALGADALQLTAAQLRHLEHG
jgi:aryl-alcohol dehydrogenase-like predicted oxidoreductase